MGFLDFIKQYDLIGTPSHRFGKSAALLIAHITGRGTNQTGNGVLLHVLAHVNPQEGALVVEEECRKGLYQFRLADAGWPEEQE